MPDTEIMKGTPWSRIRGTKQREQRSLGDCWQWKANEQCSEGDNCSFRHDKDKRAKSTQPNPSPRSSSQQSVKNASRTRSPRGRSPSGKWLDCRARIYFRGTCTTPFFEKWHPPEWLFYKSENGCRIVEKCSYAHRQVDEQPTKKSQKNVDKIAVATFMNTRQLGCVFEDMEPPKSTTTLRKSSTISKPIRCVQFTTMLREPHQRNPNAPKFEDRSREETERQERYAREAAWRLAKNIVKGENKAAFFSPSENWCLLAPSAIKPEEREFVVASGVSMHMISKKDLNSVEIDTLTKSCSPTTVITANGEVQTHEEAIVDVKELDIFLTLKVLENTPAVLSLGKHCDENGYSYEGSNGQKPHLIKTGCGYNVTLRISSTSWFQACQIRLQDLILQHQ